ncbi:MAG: hypothetical protein K0S33_78 [Bacteroidetes bacterium]|jgi:hypothetical protein|nr:hypothetical protein [Bacteroidota bacterium]
MTAEQIIEDLKQKVSKRILEKGYDSLELLAEFHVRDTSDLSHTNEKEIFVKNGIKDEASFGPSFDYKKLFELFGDQKPEYFYFRGNKEQVELYSDVTEHGITALPEFADIEKFIFNRMNVHLEEGVEYINDLHIPPVGAAPIGLFYAHRNGVKDNAVIKSIYLLDDKEILFKLAFDTLVKNLEQGKMVRIIARKDLPLEIAYLSAGEMLAGIKPFYDFLGDYYEIKFDLVFTGEMDRHGLPAPDFSGYYTQNGRQLELENCPTYFFKYLCLLLEPKPERFEVHITKDSIKVFADKAYPEHGIEAKTEDLGVAPDDPESICKFIESGRENKMKAALAAIAQNKETQKRLEQRYLNYVRACSENPKATLADMKAEMFSEDTKEIFISHHPKIANDYISFGYASEEESKRLIDFIGAMVKNYIDAGGYIKKLKTAYDKNEFTYEIYEGQTKKLKDGIRREIKLNPDGWYSQAYRLLLNTRVTKIQLDKSAFFGPDRMLFLKEYMIYLNCSAEGYDMHIDVFNCINLHDLTEVYWLFQQIPRITWFQTTPAYPPYTLKQKREAKIRIDNGDWEELNKN